MTLDLGTVINRRGEDSKKWNRNSPDILPLDGAEMEFTPAEPILEALHRRVDHRMFGYHQEPSGLREVLADRLQSRFGWTVSPDALVFLPRVVTGLNLACRAYTDPGDKVIVPTPIYDAIAQAPANCGTTRVEVPLIPDSRGYYRLDDQALQASASARTRLLMLCNPHNPVGRAFGRDELGRVAEICVRHDLLICSDEVYCDWVFDGRRHVPIASLAPEVAQRTITLLGTSKSHNLAGLNCGVAVIENPELRARFEQAAVGTVPPPSALAYTAALAAYRDAQPWQDEVLAYLHQNRRFLIERARETLPGISLCVPEATPTAWLDCRHSGIPGDPHEFFFRDAKVSLNSGRMYGETGAGFLRLAFGCPRTLLEEGLSRMALALASISRV